MTSPAGSHCLDAQPERQILTSLAHRGSAEVPGDFVGLRPARRTARKEEYHQGGILVQIGGPAVPSGPSSALLRFSCGGGRRSTDEVAGPESPLFPAAAGGLAQIAKDGTTCDGEAVVHSHGVA